MNSVSAFTSIKYTIKWKLAVSQSDNEQNRNTYYGFFIFHSPINLFHDESY